MRYNYNYMAFREGRLLSFVSAGDGHYAGEKDGFLFLELLVISSDCILW